MRIDLSKIAKSIDQTAEWEVAPELSVFRSYLGEYPLTWIKPLILHFENCRNEELLLKAESELNTVIPCGRCLTEVKTPLHLDMESRFLVRQTGLVEVFEEDSFAEGEPDDTETEEEREETDYLIGFELDVEQFVNTGLMVNWPMKVLCRDDCRGICRVCGRNLNTGSCNCDQTELDPRMAAFQDVFNKFKEV